MALNEKESEVKKKPHEMTNAEYVSKLMAATPAYFFTPTSLPQAGHNFFFSELLRSLVQKRKAEELNLAAIKAKSMTKKVRKPMTYQQFQKPSHEQEYKKPKLSEDVVKTSVETNENDQENSQDSVINVDKDDPPVAINATSTNTQQQSSVSSLAQSAFYPYVDPLHFFIDLRVSAGQIYDRKKEAYLQQALSTWNNNNPIIGKNRNSAFKVPTSSQNEQNQNFNAINLISNQQQQSESSRGFQKMYKSTRSDDDEDEVTAAESNSKKSEDVQIFDLDKTDRMN
ncbi:hypothetical protein PVAND_002741 [Polypedilum vanderplanki]|uniref:Uncharacterized protein n=1 Tax=Polypedilum vanderplanki TaxID=319348 RepID=A0A9J6BSA7_POLVA|nr:hypothetical protein PVAND_002741 [Polypedilum vanderplanki]